MLTGVVAILVLSSLDISKAFKGRISKTQLLKNVTNTTSATVGGVALGVTIGPVVPGIGTAVCNIIGGLLGSMAVGELLRVSHLAL